MTREERVKALGKSELLAQLAEEAAELSQAALKLRRAVDGVNPTPVSVEDAAKALIEEYCDVWLCARMVFDPPIDDWEARHRSMGKLERWAERLEGKK